MSWDWSFRWVTFPFSKWGVTPRPLHKIEFSTFPSEGTQIRSLHDRFIRKNIRFQQRIFDFTNLAFRWIGVVVIIDVVTDQIKWKSKRKWTTLTYDTIFFLKPCVEVKIFRWKTLNSVGTRQNMLVPIGYRYIQYVRDKNVAHTEYANSDEIMWVLIQLQPVEPKNIMISVYCEEKKRRDWKCQVVIPLHHKWWIRSPLLIVEYYW